MTWLALWWVLNVGPVVTDIEIEVIMDGIFEKLLINKLNEIPPGLLHVAMMWHYGSITCYFTHNLPDSLLPTPTVQNCPLNKSKSLNLTLTSNLIIEGICLKLPLFPYELLIWEWIGSLNRRHFRVSIRSGSSLPAVKLLQIRKYKHNLTFLNNFLVLITSEGHSSEEVLNKIFNLIDRIPKNWTPIEQLIQKAAGQHFKWLCYVQHITWLTSLCNL